MACTEKLQWSNIIMLCLVHPMAPQGAVRIKRVLPFNRLTVRRLMIRHGPYLTASFPRKALALRFTHSDYFPYSTPALSVLVMYLAGMGWSRW